MRVIDASLCRFTSRKVGWEYMSYDEKVQSLVKRLKPHVLEVVDGVPQAQEMLAEFVRTKDSQVAKMAELFYENQDRFGISRQVKQISGHPGTKMSALREAIKLTLSEYIEERDELSKGLEEALSEDLVLVATVPTAATA